MSRQSEWAAAQVAEGKCRQCGRPRGSGGTSQHCAECAAKHRAAMAAIMRQRRQRQRARG